MTPLSVIITIAAYFAILFTVSYIAGRKADNEGFFVGNRKSSWYVVAFAMVGSAISGVTYVSVPGMVAATVSVISRWSWASLPDSSSLLTCLYPCSTR